MNEQQKQHETLWDRALEAGITAGEAVIPRPLRIKGYEPILDGVCGFGYVNVPGNTSFGRWVKKYGHGSKSYRGGLDIYIGHFGQSYEKKLAMANAMAEVLRENDVAATARGNID